MIEYTVLTIVTAIGLGMLWKLFTIHGCIKRVEQEVKDLKHSYQSFRVQYGQEHSTK